MISCLCYDPRLCYGPSSYVLWSLGYAMVLPRMCYGLLVMLWFLRCAMVLRMCYCHSGELWSFRCAMVPLLCYGPSAMLWSLGCNMIPQLCYGPDSISFFNLKPVFIQSLNFQNNMVSL